MKLSSRNNRLNLTTMVSGVTIGGNAPVAIQSMTNTDTLNVAATVAQCKRM